MENKNAVFAIFAARRALASFGRKSLRGSSSVEASLVMGILLLAIAAFLGFSYDCCRRTNAVMQLHEMTEVLRYREEEKELSRKSGVSSLYVMKKGSRVTGKAQPLTGQWGMELVHHVFDPEEALRFGALFAGEEKDEQGEKEQGEKEQKETERPWTGQ